MRRRQADVGLDRSDPSLRDVLRTARPTPRNDQRRALSVA